MEDETLYFLPSEVARLILGYLLDEGYKLTYKTFLKECPNLKEYLTCITQGHKYSLKINCMTLVEILEDYGSMKSTEITRRVANPSMASLWKQFDTVVDCIKKQVTSKQFLYEGSMVQSTRTRQQVRQYQRNKILQSCLTVMDQQSKSESKTLNSSSTLAMSPVASTSEIKSPLHDHTAVDTSPRPQTQEEDLDERDDNEPMETCSDDDTELPPLDNGQSKADEKDVHIVKDGKEEENSSCQNTDKKKTESVVIQTISRHTEDEIAPVSTAIATIPLNSEECVPSTSQQTQALPTQHSYSNTALSDSQNSVTQENLNPSGGNLNPSGGNLNPSGGNLNPSGGTSETHVPSEIPHTPRKQLSRLSTDYITDKSPRRKRPPKRKSIGEKRKSQSERPGSSVQNESSNSTDGSLHDNMVPQIMNQLLSNPHLPHKLAENINKSLHPDATPPQAPPPEIQTFADIGFTDRSLEDILDEHETRMTQSQIECIIDNTQSDPDLGSLFGIFNIGIPCTGTVPVTSQQTHTDRAVADITTLTSSTENQKSTGRDVDSERSLCTPVTFTQTQDKDEGVLDTYVPLDSYETPSTFSPPQEPDKTLPGHFTPITDNNSPERNAPGQKNQPLVNHIPVTCSGICTSVLETRDSIVYSPLPGVSGAFIPVQNKQSLVSHTPVTCSGIYTSVPETRDSVVYSPLPGMSGVFTTAQNNQPLVSHTLVTCSGTSVLETRDSVVNSPLPGRSGIFTPAQNNQPLVNHTSVTCSGTSVQETRDSTVCSSLAGRTGAFTPVQCSVSTSSSSPRCLITKQSVIQSPSYDSINKSVPNSTCSTSQSEPNHGQHNNVSIASSIHSTWTTITNCVTAQPFATTLTSQQPLTSQPSSPPITTAVTSLQPVTSAFSPEFGPMKMNVENSLHGFPVLSLTTTSQSNLDFSDSLMKTNSLAEKKTSPKDQFNEKKKSTSYKSFRSGVDLSRNSSTPIAAGRGMSTTETTGGVSSGVITSEASSVMQALATSADSLTTINIHSLYDTVESKEQETQKPSKKGKKEPKRKKSPRKMKSDSSNNSSGWSSELSALVKITSPEKKTSSSKSPKKTISSCTKPANKVMEKLKEQHSYMEILSPGGKTVQHIPVLEVDSLSEYGDAQDLIPLGTMVATTPVPNSDTQLTTESPTKTKTRSKSKALPKRCSPKSPALTAIKPATTSAQVMMTSSPHKPLTPLKTPNLTESAAQEQSALLSMPTLHSLSSPSMFSTSLSLPVMLSSQQAVNSHLSGVSTPKLSIMAVTQSSVTNIPQATASKESPKTGTKTPEKVLSTIVYTADRDFLDSPQSVDYTELNESTGEDMAHKLFENADKVIEQNKPYLSTSFEKQVRKEVHVRSLNFGVNDNVVAGIGNLPSKSEIQQRNIFGLEVTQSPEGIRQLAYGRGHKNPNKSAGPGVKKASSTSSGKRKTVKSAGVVREKRGTSDKLSSSCNTQINLDNQSNSSLDPVTHIATDIHSFIIQRNEKRPLSSVSETKSVATLSNTTTSSEVNMTKSNTATSDLKGMSSQKLTSVEIPRNTKNLDDFIPDSSGKVYLSPATSIVLTPEKSDLEHTDQVLHVGDSKSKSLPCESFECRTGSYSDVKSTGSVHLLNDMRDRHDGKKELSDSEHSSVCEDVEVFHSEGSVVSSQHHQESDRDIFADTDDDCVMPSIEPPLVVSEISHDIAVIPSVFSGSDKVKKVVGKSVVQNKNSVKNTVQGRGLSDRKHSLLHSQEKSLGGSTCDNVSSNINKHLIRGKNSRYEAINDLSVGSGRFHHKLQSLYDGSTNKNICMKFQTTDDLYISQQQNRKSVALTQEKMNSDLLSDVSCSDKSSSRGLQSALQTQNIIRDNSMSGAEEEDVDIMSEWDNPWQAGLTSGDTTVVENTSRAMTPVQQEQTIQHDSTGIQRTRKPDFITENMKIHKETLNNRKLKYTSMENQQTCIPLHCSETVSHDSPQTGEGENFTQEDRLLCSNRGCGQDIIQNTGIQHNRILNLNVDRSAYELERNDKSVSLTRSEMLHASQQNSAKSLPEGDDPYRNYTSQRSADAASLQKVRSKKQQCPANSSQSKLISFKKYQRTSNKVLSVPEDEDSYDLPDLSTPTKLSDSKDKDVGGSGCSDKSTASHTSYQSAVTPRLYQHVTPPKKRITASLKNGDSLYFFSTQSTKADGSKVEQASGKLRSSVKSPGHVSPNSPRSSIVVNSPRRQRKTTLTPRKELDASPNQVPESRVSESPRREEEVAQTTTKKTRQKRQHEGSSSTDSKIPEKKTKKSNKVVDLAKVDVDKFLSKLHK